MLRLLIICFLSFFIAIEAQSQIIDFENDKNKKTGLRGAADDSDASKFLNKTSLSFIAEGISPIASAEILKLRIGEEKFNLPFYIYASSISEGLTDNDNAKETINNLILPNGGVINASISDSRKLLVLGDQTNLSLAFHGGFKYAVSKDSLTGESQTFPSGFLDFGFRFTTGAAVVDSPDKTGTFFFQGKVFGTLLDKQVVEKSLGQGIDSYLFGISSDLGIFITDVINFKAGFGYLLSDIPNYNSSKGIIQFSVDYGM